jgi:hypothetical protein
MFGEYWLYMRPSPDPVAPSLTVGSPYGQHGTRCGCAACSLQLENWGRAWARVRCPVRLPQHAKEARMGRRMAYPPT